MGDKISLSLHERTVHGKKVARLRRDGITPVVVYGPGMEPIAAQAVSGELSRVVARAGRHTPVDIDVAGKKKIAMIKGVDIDPTKGLIRHVSFHAVRQNKPVEAEVPVRMVGQGESEAEKAGLVVLQTVESVHIKALPKDLPEALEADIHSLAEAGQKLLLADITLPSGVELVEHETGHHEEDEEEHHVTELVIASVWEPAALEAANAAAAGSAEDEAATESEHGEDTDQESQAEEAKPGGKDQDEPKQSNVDANK
ncbi:MAG TPA: 50S ribosomal protein L25 [Candidatus Saccharimonadaceae bacterium]|nr:50S ribosomal protein L25 [Candidatus Saccharimonadaceae bacterium]